MNKEKLATVRNGEVLSVALGNIIIDISRTDLENSGIQVHIEAYPHNRKSKQRAMLFFKESFENDIDNKVAIQINQ